MEEYSDEILEAIQQQTQEWGESFSKSRFFNDLTPEQQQWVEPVISFFTEMMYSYHGCRPEKWTVRTVEECCTQTMPRKVSIENDFFHAISPVLAAYFGYLNSVGYIRNGASLIHSIRRIKNKIIDNAGDSGNWGMAKSFFSIAQNAGIDISNEGALQKFISRFNAGEFGGINLFNIKLPGMQAKGKKRASQDLKQTLLQIATRISKDIAKGKLPPLSDEMKQFHDKMPQVVIELLSLMVDHFDTHEDPNDFLVSTFLNLMGQQLEEIRYAVERKFEWAEKFVEDFQNEVAELANSDRLPVLIVKDILDAIFNAKLEHSPVLLLAHQAQIEREVPKVGMPNRNEFLQILKGFVAEHENDPFRISAGIADLVRYMPEDAQSAIIGEFFHADLPGLKDAVALLTLNPEAWIRNEALQWLLGNAKSITPTVLRRLIVIRNWIPEGERKILDQVTKAARVKGVECAQWAAVAKPEKIQASQIDGAGAQGFMLVIKQGAKFRLSSVLVKQGVGIADAWSTPVITKRELSETLNHAREHYALADISDRYLNTIVCHNIQVALDSGVPPQVGLLQVAELIGATGWIAQRINIQSLLEEIIDEAAAPGTPQIVPIEDILQFSDSWGELPGISDSWFQDSQEVVKFLQHTKIRKRDDLIQKILVDFCEPNRQSWAEKFAWTAFWFNEQPPLNGKKNQLAYKFAVFSRELYAGQPMTKLPLMGAIAKRTIDNFRG